MRKLRVDWTKEEDSFLLLCKVAGSYLCQNMSYRMVPCTQVRIACHLPCCKCSLIIANLIVIRAKCCYVVVADLTKKLLYWMVDRFQFS
jgi:hypothetical protein